MDASASVLEPAAGTGVATRALPAGVELVATDLNPSMLERAQAKGAARPVRLGAGRRHAPAVRGRSL